VVNLLRERLVRAHGARCESLAVHTPKEMFHVTALANAAQTVPSKEQQAVKEAFEEAFEAASQFAEGSGEGLTSEAFLQAIKSSKNFGRKPRRPKSAAKPLPDAAQKEAERQAAFEKEVEKALAKLHTATDKAGLWESLQTSNVHVEPARNRPPPQQGSSHVRAQFFQVLRTEQSGVMERFIAEAVLDKTKPELNAWLKKYMKSERLRKHPDLQDLQLILRRQLTGNNPTAMLKT